MSTAKHMTHEYSHSQKVRDVDATYTQEFCTCGAIWHRGECVGGHEEMVAFLKEVMA